MSTAVSGSTDLSAGGHTSAAERRTRIRQSLKLSALLLPGVIFLVVGLLWPFASMLGISFYDKYPANTGFTLDHYLLQFEDSYALFVALRTLALGVLVTLLTAIIGYPVAWYLARSDSRLKHLVFLGVVSPLLVSIVVRTLGWTILLGNEGLVNALLVSVGIVDEPLRLMQSFWSVVLGMTHVLLPFMVLSISSVLSKIDQSLIESAAVMGASPFQNFLRIVLPLSVQGLAAGSVIVFCLSIGAYITPIWLGRGQVNVMSIYIHEQMVVMVDWPAGAAASMILTLVTLLVLTLYGLILKKHARR